VQHLAPAYGYETTFTQIAEAVLGQSGSDATAILGSIIILANLSGAIWAVSRLLFAMSREGFLPAFLQDAPDGTPWLAVGVTMTAILSVVGLDLLGVLPLDRMLSLAGQNFLILYAIAAVALMLRSREWPHRILGLAVAILAAALVAAQETLTLYPLLLVGLGLLVHRKSIAGRRVAAPPAPAVNVSGRSPQPAAESAS